jgi:hypothetical protein
VFEFLDLVKIREKGLILVKKFYHLKKF